MKTSVILNQYLINLYYKNKFIKKYLFLEILILIIVSSASTLYLLDNELIFGIALEILTVFFVLVIYFMNRNERIKALELNGDNEREYEFLFKEESLEIVEEKKITKEISYADLKVKKFKDLYVFKNKNKNIDSLIYIIPLDFFSKIEWKSIFMMMRS